MWWKAIQESEVAFTKSPLFFILILQTVQFFTCILFSFADVYFKRIETHRLMYDALKSSIGFIPFILFWKMNLVPFVRALPESLPDVPTCIYQLVICLCFSDLLHYWTHRLLHSNKFLKTHVHSVHHSYEGPIYSWVGSHAHPIEVVMNMVAIYLPFVCFAHVAILWLFSIIATINSVCIHSGYHSVGLYRFFPGLVLSPQNHESHHAKNATRNYGNILNIWDRLFSTFK